MIKRGQEDMELVQNILNGNPQAQETLYNKYKKSVKNFLKNKYSFYYDLDDDVSEIMIKVFVGLNTYDSQKSKFESWVFSIAKNHMIDKWRNNTCIATLTTNNTITYTTSCDMNYDISNNGFITSNNTGMISAIGNITTTNNCSGSDFENCNSINYISTQLAPQDFTLLEMKYVQGYDYNEIGSEFNVSSNTISNRVNYIKTKLKKNNPEIIYE
jgi:RNA polymerase sigma factor (sigma-70 family)